jgi:hypothetical protein
VFDVVCSDERAINKDNGCEKPVGNTVKVEKATCTNSVGDALLMSYWKDPAIDPAQRAPILYNDTGDSDAALDDL